MKSRLRNSVLAGILLLTAALFSSCQEEIVDIDPIDSTQVVTPGSVLFGLVTNTATFDGSFDDLLDSANCTSVKLPVDVIIEDTTITISSSADYVTFRNVMKSKGVRPGDHEFVYPIVLILRDYTEVDVNNEDELEIVTDACENGVIEDEDIECLDFVYPISISFYDASTEQLINYTITSDLELYSLFEIIDPGDYLSFNYPIQMKLSDSTLVTVNDNDELEDLIDLWEDSCDEGDDYEDDLLEDGQLISFLTSGSWVISSFFDNEDLAPMYSEYVLDFDLNGTIDVQGQGSVLQGEWETGGNNDQLRLDLDFASQDPLDLLNQDWDIVSYTSDGIILGHSGGGDSYSNFLVFEREFTVADDELEIVLKSGDWSVDTYVVSDTEKTEDFAGFTVNFSNQGLSSATDQIEVIEGSWISISAAFLILDYPDAPFDQLKGEWKVVGIDVDAISLEMPRGEGSDPDILVLVKI